MSAVSVSNVRPAHIPGDAKTSVCDVTCSSSYPTDGEPVTLADFGFSSKFNNDGICNIRSLSTNNATVTFATLVVAADGASAKVKLYDVTYDEVDSTDNVSDVVVRVSVSGY